MGSFPAWPSAVVAQAGRRSHCRNRTRPRHHPDALRRANYRGVSRSALPPQPLPRPAPVCLGLPGSIRSTHHFGLGLSWLKSSRVFHRLFGRHLDGAFSGLSGRDKKEARREPGLVSLAISGESIPQREYAVSQSEGEPGIARLAPTSSVGRLKCFRPPLRQVSAGRHSGGIASLRLGAGCRCR